MTPAPISALSETSTVLCLVFIFLVPCAGAGLALINTGLARSRSAAHLMMSSLCVFSVAALVYFICGFAWQGFAGGPAHVLMIGGKEWNWIAAGPLFLRGLPLDGSPASLAALFGMLSVGLAALIPLGSGVDRWRLGASCASTALLAGWTYPLFGHWVWGGGWLAQLGTSYGLGRGFVDTEARSRGTVASPRSSSSGSWARKYTRLRDGMPNAILGHNSVLVLFGCLLALLGWWGLIARHPRPRGTRESSSNRNQYHSVGSRRRVDGRSDHAYAVRQA